LPGIPKGRIRTPYAAAPCSSVTRIARKDLEKYDLRDAVAMSVLDPFEVFEIEVWPLPEFQSVSGKDSHAKAHLDSLEYLIYKNSLLNSKFGAILNEKNPSIPIVTVTEPPSFRGRIVSDDVYRIRSHPDFRIARRALIISRLAQVISERKVQGGLRRVLLTQAKRLQWLAQRRFDALGGEASVESEKSKVE
jgi:hypothetical protein